MLLSEEHERLKDAGTGPIHKWHKWGPYVSERAWGTVREDYSGNGDAWNYFPFDHAVSRAYRWGEDGLAGWCDRYQILVFAPVFWNEKDPILKERLFGLNSYEGNHGEDVKEYYYYLDGTPTHSYMKYLYKYPHDAFPYQQLRDENRKRSAQDLEYELVDTGVFSENRYFDIFIEYAKAGPEDLFIKIEAWNRSKVEAPLHILPHLWFRNQWAWGDIRLPEPKITKGSEGPHHVSMIADDSTMNPPSNLTFEYSLGKQYLYASKEGMLLFTDNETRFPDKHSDKTSYFKDGIQRAVVQGEKSAINPEQKGTKGCFHYVFKNVPAQGKVTVYLRLVDKEMENPLEHAEKTIAQKKQEADRFYEKIHPKHASDDEKLVQRQALAGILWSKQFYYYDVRVWLQGDNTYFPPPQSRYHIRNVHWRHLNSMRILVMPDKWEYPWFAAWDLAFHCLSLGLVDIALAKEQLWLLLFDQFLHPNGQIPAYEWEFSDLNPPVQAWAAIKLYEMQKEQEGKEDRDFLERCFHKLLMNFAWWVNKVDSQGNNVFEGGFLGLDNITVFDRSQKMQGGVVLQQSDGTGWMAMFCLNLMKMALELAKKDNSYESLATKFFEHYVYIAHAMKIRGFREYNLWDQTDGFFYDTLTYPDGKFEKFKVRSMVGIIPLYGVEVIDEEELQSVPLFKTNFEWFLKNRKNLVEACIIPTQKKGKRQYVLALMNQSQLRSVLKYVWDPNEFRSEFGLRSLSKHHEKNPFYFKDNFVGYEPGESLFKVKGGNSNWRGPIWMPTSYLLIEALKKFSEAFHQEDIEVVVGDEKPICMEAMAASFADRLISIFTKNEKGIRPVFHEHFPFRQDPHWSDYLHYYEHFHGENGHGIGASHQTGWTALIANLIHEFRN
ncbi:MAG TPA: glucosidase [Rhabdochlamydiaceae bacterium]|nr:glucosidase [Rhabdochlamydiaceae bacterium]